MRALRWLYLGLLIVGLPMGAYWSRSTRDSDVIQLRARMPEAGGWSRDSFEVPVGQEVTFRLTSDDVMHGFKVAKADFEAVSVKPGTWVEATWTPSEPGIYTFYCTRWCGPNHWRMTGEIRVVDPSGYLPTPTPPPPPRYLIYDIDLDAARAAPRWAGLKPSAGRGGRLGVKPSVDWLESEVPDLTTPQSAWDRLRADPALADLDDDQIWDLLASLWTARLDVGAVARGMEIYAAVCAACHGERGEGDGVMAGNFKDPAVADFADFSRMAVVHSILLEGKILRGGMGTGMPYWGPILEPGEVEALVETIWWLAFSSAGEPGLP